MCALGRTAFFFAEALEKAHHARFLVLHVERDRLEGVLLAQRRNGAVDVLDLHQVAVAWRRQKQQQQK